MDGLRCVRSNGCGRPRWAPRHGSASCRTSPDIVTALQAARWEAFHTGRYSRAADPARSGGCCWEIWKSAAAQCSGDITGIVSNDLGV